MTRSAFVEAFAFRPAPVTALSVITYISIVAALLWIHLVPPNVASSSELDSWGIDLDQAWQDLRVLTEEFRPYNSRRNDEVRDYLLRRIRDIVGGNIDAGYDGTVDVVDDLESNVLFAAAEMGSFTVYFEGTNIMVHIHGTDADLSPVLVNAHYDSVSTGYGATDDGVGVVSILQVIQAFTHPHRGGDDRIKRGLLALLNNGEEDFMNGARAFAIHPMANLSHSFLNLEGAGAGGRAMLFRSTDAEVMKWYKMSKRPFGSVISGDGFKRGLIRSETDYKVFVENLGMRGLDVAFWEPRSQYHTEDDDVRHTSKESLWHMLGTSLQTLNAATSDTSREFDRDGDVPTGTGHDGVWFDLFGRAFAILRLHTLFALTITLIVVPFVVMLATAYLLYANNKFYYLSNTPIPATEPGFPKTTRGWRGFFRFPVAFVFASATVVGLAFLVNKVNPMIAYASQYSVWAMFLSIWWSLAWFILRGADADRIRPTALGRGYAFLEQWALWFGVLIAVAVVIDRAQLASGYWVLISYTGVFLSAWISLLELLALPRKPDPQEYTQRNHRHIPGSYGSEGQSLLAPSEPPSANLGSDDEDDATEATPLFRGSNRPTTFGGYSRTDDGPEDTAYSSDEEYTPPEGVFGKEQPWSKDLPSWVWIFQFFLSVPMPLIISVSVALIASTGICQTGADGNSTLTIYLFMAILSIIILLPGSPFYHRITYHVTTFIFFVFLGTLIYNLVAFPFSSTYRLKIYFQQTVDLDLGNATTHLVGHPDFIQRIVTDYIPSARGHEVVVTDEPSRRLKRVSYPADPPSPAPGAMSKWIMFNASQVSEDRASFKISALESRACKLLFSRAVVASVDGSRILTPPVATKELRLWRREWDAPWIVEVSWAKTEGEEKLSGEVVCLWSDANDVKRAIPGLWEVEQYSPSWAVVSKLADGLVEGKKSFSL